MKIDLDKNYKIILLLIILFGFALRLVNIDKNVLWQDEVETTINTIQVVEDGYPHGYFKGKPIFETKAYIEIEDPIYKYTPTNYYGSKYENNKGWLTYYFLAPFIKIFGVSEKSARLPFFIFYILTTLFIFLVSQLFFKNKKISLLATLFFSVDYFAIMYGKQARYYGIFMFLPLATFYFNYLYIQKNKSKYLFWLTTLLILTFHTHIVLSLFLILFFLYYDFIKTKKIKINRILILNGLYFLVLTIPWLFLVKFWVNFLTHSDIYNPNDGIKLLWILGIFIVLVFIKFYKNITKNKYNPEISKKIPEEILYFFWTYIIFLPLTIPSESFAIRIFIPLLPFFAIIFSYLLFKITKHKYDIKYLTIIVIFILSYTIIFMTLRQYTYYGKTNWINNVFSYAQTTNFDSKNDIILSSWQDLSLAFYSDYQIYRTETIRPDYVNNYPNRVLFVFPFKHLENACPKGKVCNFQDPLLWMNIKPYSFFEPRLKNCQNKLIKDEILLFDCPALQLN